MFATAARLAIALGINRDGEWKSESFFTREMRRRLWYTMSQLDTHLSFDRGSELILCPKLVPKLPLNTNDKDFGLNTVEHGEAREGFTEMSLALLNFRLQAIGRSMIQSKDGLDGGARIATIEEDIKRLLQDCNPNSSPFAWTTCNASLSILAGLKLHMKRPIHPGGQTSRNTNDDSANILRLAVTFLEHDIMKRTDTRGEPFRWFGMVQWHPLAVAIAECYACNGASLLQHI